MERFSSLFSGLTGSCSTERGKNCVNDAGREVSKSMVKEAKKNELILCSSGVVDTDGSNNFASVYTKRGNKGVNQDCFLVWEEFGCQKDMMFCGVFDGHGSWGHFVAKQVRDSMPSALLRNWQETLAVASIDPKFELVSDKNLQQFSIWKQSYLKTCVAIDRELKQQRRIDTFNSGTTALTIVRQGDHIFISNVGDSRAVLATTSDDGTLVPVQLTTDFKPNLPQECERITQCKGRVFCFYDEPGVHRVWLPDEDRPGLAMSRAFGDFCVKGFGVISVPEVTQRSLSSKDQFVVLATDGVWDVISNQEAVQIVSSTPERGKAANRLVECATRAWKRKRQGIATDDINGGRAFDSSETRIYRHLINSAGLLDLGYIGYPFTWNNQRKRQWFVDGQAAFQAIASAIEEAKSEIFITGWWLCPELYLRRPFPTHGSSRLDEMIEAKAKEGVQVYMGGQACLLFLLESTDRIPFNFQSILGNT